MTRRDEKTRNTHLSDLEQEGDPEGAEDFLVEVSNGDQHFTVLVQVHLVQRNLLRWWGG